MLRVGHAGYTSGQLVLDNHAVRIGGEHIVTDHINPGAIIKLTCIRSPDYRLWGAAMPVGLLVPGSQTWKVVHQAFA